MIIVIKNQLKELNQQYKKLLVKTLLALLLLIPSLSWGNKLLPLNEYILQQDANDPAVYEYIQFRCASVWMGAANLIETQEPEVFEQFQDSAIKTVMVLTDKYMEFNSVDYDTAFENVTKSVINITNLYIDEMNENWQKTGNYFMNSYVEEDLYFCKEVFS